MLNQPLVSVFLPYYNDEKFLEYSIKSVLEQSYENFELILLNHASTDSSYNIAHSFQDFRIKHVDMSINLGAGGGILFQKMLDNSSGKYIKTLCADDMLKSNCLEILVDYMEKNPEVDFAFGDLNYINEKGCNLNNSWFNSRSAFCLDDDEVSCIQKYASGVSFLPYVGNISKREIFNNIIINKTFIMLFDMSLWLSLLCKGYKIGFCNEKVADYRISEFQISSTKNKESALKYSYFEHSKFWKIFQTIDNIELVKKVFNESKYLDCLNKIEDIPFFVAVSLFREWPAYAYEYLAEVLQDDIKRSYYIKVFNYGIKELRCNCLLGLGRKKKSLFTKFKNEIYTKNVKELNILDLIFLLIKFIINAVLFRPLKVIHMHKPKKEYSL